MPPKRKRAAPANNESDFEEPTVRQAATNVGFYDPNIDPKLYTFTSGYPELELLQGRRGRAQDEFDPWDIRLSNIFRL